jgi:hypothetical protein
LQARISGRFRASCSARSFSKNGDADEDGGTQAFLLMRRAPFVLMRLEEARYDRGSKLTNRRA